MTEKEQSLKTLGFKCFSGYQKSTIFREIKKMLADKFGKNCACCGQPVTSYVFTSYSIDTLIGKSIKNIYGVCKNCHDHLNNFKLKNRRDEIHKMRTKGKELST